VARKDEGSENQSLPFILEKKLKQGNSAVFRREGRVEKIVGCKGPRGGTYQIGKKSIYTNC